VVKIKIVKTGSGFPPVGSIHGARRLNRDGALLDLYPDFQIIDGGYSGTIIPFKCAFVLPEERTYTEAEYNEILQQRDKAIDDLAKYAQELVDLQQERAELLQTIEKAAEEQRLVELPRDVAAALDSTGGPGHVLAIISANQAYFTERQRILREFATNRPDDFLSALVNGYTAEQTPRERFRAKVSAFLRDWSGSTLDEKLIEELTEQIVEHAKELT